MSVGLNVEKLSSDMQDLVNRASLTPAEFEVTSRQAIELIRKCAREVTKQDPNLVEPLKKIKAHLLVCPLTTETERSEAREAIKRMIYTAKGKDTQTWPEVVVQTEAMCTELKGLLGYGAEHPLVLKLQEQLHALAREYREKRIDAAAFSKALSHFDALVTSPARMTHFILLIRLYVSIGTEAARDKATELAQILKRNQSDAEGVSMSIVAKMMIFAGQAPANSSEIKRDLNKAIERLTALEAPPEVLEPLKMLLATIVFVCEDNLEESIKQCESCTDTAPQNFRAFLLTFRTPPPREKIAKLLKPGGDPLSFTYCNYFLGTGSEEDFLKSARTALASARENKDLLTPRLLLKLPPSLYKKIVSG